tara:strand:+ start:847 stop:1593 length:747 start_codon:yes stop_codon:yes gene_type:complete
MKAIILSAGDSSRLGNLTKELPKSLLDINGKSIIQRQIETFRNNGIKEIIVVVGSNKDKFQLNDVEFVIDKNFQEHDILGSLMEAKNYIKNDVLIFYSDILFEEKVLKQILGSDSDIGIVVERNWESAYVGRTDHPKSEAENVLIDGTKRIVKIQKNIKNSREHVSEFLGITKLSPNGSEAIVTIYENLLKTHSGNFHDSKSLEKAYLTDMFQELIETGINLEPIFINGKWCEIDTIQDLENARNLFS